MKKFISLVVLILITISVVVLASKLKSRNENLSPDESDALYGGDLESGYPSAGYLVNYLKDSDQRKSCGVSVINDKQAITAGHCVDNTSAVFIGAGEFRDRKSDFLPVTKINLKQSWIKSRSTEDDIAVLFFNNTKFDSFATIEAPKQGCDYHIIAYGRSDDNTNKVMPRKGADVCISDITNKTFRIIGANNAGICFGDSGSPIYKKDTNKLVGVISSIVLSNNSTKENPCNIGNTGLAIRADSTSDLIKDENLNDSNYISISNLKKNPRDENLLDKLGLNQEIDLSDTQTQYKIAIISVIITVFGIVIIWLKK